MFISRHFGGNRVVLIQIKDKRHKGFVDFKAEGNEFLELAKASGAFIIELIEISLDKFDSGYLISSGKRQAIYEKIRESDAELAIVNIPLTSTQERNLEKLWQCRVIDRVGLILDIFAQRARTFEGKLQVELAQLEHIKTRLVRGWTHLERQKGGIGLRGPGETQLETDKRLIQVRIDALKRNLAKVRKQRQNNRRQRQKQAIPIVALVGYTNAGKSSIFNSLTDANVYVANKLFATLDTTLRKLDLGSGLEVILADTVGFIKDLPHKLVEAFSATLEEATKADLILHIIDASDWHRQENIQAVEKVLQELGIKDIPIIKVFNKIDLLESNSESKSDFESESEQNSEIDLPTKNTLTKELQIHEQDTICVWTCATDKTGLSELNQAIKSVLQLEVCEGDLLLEYTSLHNRLRSILYATGAVKQETYHEAQTLLQISIVLIDFQKILAELGLKLEELTWLTKSSKA